MSGFIALGKHWFAGKNLEVRATESDIGNASDYGRWLLSRGPEVSSGVAVTEGTALGLPAAYSCINVLSQTLANIPLELMKITNKGPKPAFNHPLYDLLFFNPEDNQTSYNWRLNLEGHRNGWGNAYVGINRVNGMPVELETWLPDRTTIQTMHDNTRDYFYQTEFDGETVNSFPADVLHFRGLGFNGLYGYSPIQLHAEAIGLGLAIHRFGGKFFSGGLSPKGVITTDMPSNALEKYAEMMKENFGGLDLAHGTPILSKGMDYKPLTINPDDAQTLETLKYNRTEVCGIYRVPPQFIMDLQFNTFTNAADQNLHFTKHTMIPILTLWEQELDLKLLTQSERNRGYFFRFDVRWFMRGDPKGRADFYHLALQDGWVNRNEVRRWEDLAEGPPELDEFLTPTNMGSEDDSDSDSEDGDPDEDDEKNEEERMRATLLPFVRSLAEKMVSKERRTLERNKDLPKFYESDYPQFIERHLSSITLMMEPHVDSSEFIKKFTGNYIQRQMCLPIPIRVDEKAVFQVFYSTFDEVKKWKEDS